MVTKSSWCNLLIIKKKRNVVDYVTWYWQNISFDLNSGFTGTNVIKRWSSGRREIGYWIILISSPKTAATSCSRLTDRWRYSQAVRSRFIAKILYWLLAGNLSISQYRSCLQWILASELASSPALLLLSSPCSRMSSLHSRSLRTYRRSSLR